MVGGAMQAGQDISVVKGGKTPRLPGHPAIPGALALEGLNKGYSLVVNWAHYRSAGVAALGKIFQQSRAWGAVCLDSRSVLLADHTASPQRRRSRRAWASAPP